MNNYLAHAKLLLLVTGGGHRISVILFGFRLVLPDLLHLKLSKITNIATLLTNVFPQPPQYYVRVFSSHLFHQLDAALHIPLGAQQLGGGKFLPNLFREVVNTVRLAGHLNNQASRSLFMMMTTVVVVMTMMLASSHLIAESLLSLREFFLRLLRFPVAVRHKGGQVVAGVHLVKC